MIKEDKFTEHILLLHRAYSRIELFRIGEEMQIPYFEKVLNGWQIDEEEAVLELAKVIDEFKIRRIFKEHKARQWAIFRGRYYFLEDGNLSNKSKKSIMINGIRMVKARIGSDTISVLKALLTMGPSNLKDLKRKVKKEKLLNILGSLEKQKVIVTSYKGDKYQEWKILEETIPIIELELDIKEKMRKKTPSYIIKAKKTSSRKDKLKEADPIMEEKMRIAEMDQQLDEYLSDLLKKRLKQTINFGKKYNLAFLAEYLKSRFGPILYFDSLLSITQQYSIANVDIIHEYGKIGKRTGWSLALFGDPGTGKSFSTRDMILGRLSAKIGAHGLLGRNRYCGGITPARFIRIGQVYSDRVFNFIVPEFNDFFRYKGMVEPLKIAMEQGIIKYETKNEVIGPYRFTSFFSVNYNVSVHNQGYGVTINDPNFNAIEDRMLCRLHRLTKERFVEISKSATRLALGEIDIVKEAQRIRDHAILIYAIETEHPLVKHLFPKKAVMITPKVFRIMAKARKAILSNIPQKVVKFSARLEDKALRFACGASLMNYFGSDLNFIPVGKEALRYAIQFYVEEASIRSKETFEPNEVIKEIFVTKEC